MQIEICYVVNLAMLMACWEKYVELTVWTDVTALRLRDFPFQGVYDFDVILIHGNT